MFLHEALERKDVFPSGILVPQTFGACSSRRRPLWAVLLKKVLDIDALKCPKCGGQMKVISFIEQPSVIRRILKHLDLWEDPRPPPEPLGLV